MDDDEREDGRPLELCRLHAKTMLLLYMKPEEKCACSCRRIYIFRLRTVSDGPECTEGVKEK